ncbi:hypothetical protein DLM45_13275 [Hyphomicrobium methylovorum]|uniref:hypothetical protein n=1 Tax=Hyphomicrobium methylovorum TaxID=84 RepID=UPI0015E656F7|nr:hypothetical protein [Hyphomicrobium methylovorum]MBA2127185.1 hypothetical protein [Hyphomicrobium methylovorum]
MDKEMDKDKNPQDAPDFDEPVVDEDNPEWTKADFARAKRGDDMPDAIKRAFKVCSTRGR